MTTTRGSPPKEGFTLKLTDLLWEYEEAHGVARLVVMTKLRHYLNTTDMWTVIDEVKTITDEKHLNVLIGAGLRSPLWHAVIAQQAYLQGVS